MISITLLVENTVRSKDLLAEHGIAYWIETDSHSILFDTGQGFALFPNARQLGIDLSSADSIVLSHGHYDHTGGLEAMLKDSWNINLYAHPAAFEPKFGKTRQNTSRYIGLPHTNKASILEHTKHLYETKEPTNIADGIIATGEITRLTDFEDVGGPFFRDEKTTLPDPMLDDQALYFETPKGIVVLLGCAHAGVVNTLQYISDITNRNIHAVIGGMHLIDASKNRMTKTLDAFFAFNVDILAPAHCTGTAAYVEFAKQFPNQVIPPSVGMQWQF